ncbi:MAG: hypothetical protein WBG48_03500 [Pricia sp.]
MKNLCNLIFILLVTNIKAQYVVEHIANSSNTNGHITTINSSLIGSKGGLILVVSQVYGVYNNNEVGVWYDNGKWKIFNQNRKPIPINTRFNVLATVSKLGNALTHVTTSDNVKGHITTINSPLTNGHPDALLFVTQKFGKYNDTPVGVWYSEGRWKIYNEKVSKPMPIGTEFNILVLRPGREEVEDFNLNLYAFKYSNNSNGHISDLPSKLQKTSKLFASPNWKGVYNPNVTGVWYNNTNWTIFNQNRKQLPKGVQFNVLSISDIEKTNLKEDCLSFNYDNLFVESAGNGKWRVTDGASSMMMFRTQAKAQMAVKIIKHYEMTAHCFAVRPNPGLKYFKVGNVLPSSGLSSEDCIRIRDPNGLIIRRNSDNTYSILDGNSIPFSAKSWSEAKKIVQLIKDYQPKYTCYVERPNPGMVYLRK